LISGIKNDILKVKSYPKKDKMSEPGMWENLLKAFVIYPSIMALLVVNYFLYKIINNKDTTIKELITISKGDIERTVKLTTLLEILVNKKGE
jgi:hypothetical protein